MPKNSSYAFVDAEIIINTFLSILNEECSSETVSFREIARRIGCNHTNLYNYFKNFDDLRVQSLIHVAQNLRKQIIPHSTNHPPDAVFQHFVQSLVQWATQNPAIYRFLWIDNMPHESTEAVFSVLPRPEHTIVPILEKLVTTPASAQEMRRISTMVHSYVHGEIVKVLCNRNPVSTRELSITLPANALQLAKALLREIVQPPVGG